MNVLFKMELISELTIVQRNTQEEDGERERGRRWGQRRRERTQRRRRERRRGGRRGQQDSQMLYVAGESILANILTRDRQYEVRSSPKGASFLWVIGAGST